jgi:hypothetical protein
MYKIKTGTDYAILPCGHDLSLLVEEQESSKEKEDQIPRCSACGYHGNDPVREIIHGTDGPHSVIATSLYKLLPPDRRKILAFADGRQEAAFFAWYLESSYKDILTRNLILKAVKSLSESSEDRFSIDDVAGSLEYICNKERLLPRSASKTKLRNEVYKSLYREFLTDEHRISLEGVSELNWTIEFPDDMKIPKKLFEYPWSLDTDEAKQIILHLLNLMRLDKAVELITPPGVFLNWSELNIQTPQQYVRVGKLAKQRYVKTWDGKRSRRGNFLQKYLMQKGLNKDQAEKEAIDALRYIWEALCSDGDVEYNGGILCLTAEGRRLNPEWWRVQVLSDEDNLYHCNLCASTQTIYTSGVCLRHRCPGSVTSIRKSDLENNHYRTLYEAILPGYLRVEEHTAQLNKELAREYQRLFKSGKINVLSSSTTFELGVDLGNLDTVFLRNVPPESFNYAQRVGRSGRRTGFPGFAVTFCRRNPHDLYHFAEPDNRILRGKIRPPVISILNKKIIIRHITAFALSCFFKKNYKRFRTVVDLVTDFNAPIGLNDFRKFLEINSPDLENSLKAIVPQDMFDSLFLRENIYSLYHSVPHPRTYLEEQ